ncbi:MAG: Sapep family Mn(2+)-dependent dipeptidase [Oscillospiraceae bacterium]|jgi:succinyl-diaminopimelate desuccinylase|nr:Sapep family Mn(2+)-dependent dipeptidase [Oscillospiraceae bacterium]
MATNNEYKAQIDAWFEAHGEELVNDTLKLIGIKSVLGAPEHGKPYGAGAAAALDFTREWLHSHGFATETFQDCMLSADLGAETDATPKLGILVHVDTVAAHDGWDSDPFVGEVRDGVIYGRGATDNKGPAIASLYAMLAARELAPQLNLRLTHGARIIIGSAEEIGCVDVGEYLKENAPPEYVFAPDAVYPLVNVEKGRFLARFGAEWNGNEATPRVVSITGGDTPNIVPRVASAVVEGLPPSGIVALCAKLTERTGVELTAEDCESASGEPTVRITALGKAAHASRPWDGNNAQTALLALLNVLPLARSQAADALRALVKLFPHGDTRGEAIGISMSDEASGELTLNFGTLTLDAEGLTATFDARTPAVADGRDLHGITDRALWDNGLKLESISATRCHYTPQDSPLVQTLLGIYEDYTGLRGECLSLGGTTYVHNIPGGVAFGTEFPGTENRIHGANEFIGVDELILSAKMFTQAILDICG